MGVSRRDFLKAAGAGTALVGAASVLTADERGDQTLPHRELGKTGVRVPIVGVGTAPAGFRPRKEAAEFFAECLDRGATYMDTAPEFAGYGVAQKALGDVLKERRQEAFVVTKLHEPDGDKALQLLRKNLDELQTDHADLVYAHSVGSDKMDPQKVMGPDGVMRALQKAQKDGLTRFIGISGHNRPQRFLDILREFEIQVMMTAVSFVSRHIYNFEEKVWPEAHRRGVALVAMKVYGGMQGEKDQARLPDEFCREAFRYAQTLPHVSTAVLGMYDVQDLDKNLHWARTYEPLSDEEMQRLLTRGEKLAQKWGPVYGPVA